MPGATVQSVVFDPKFRALDSDSQRQVLAHIDPKYAALGDDDQKDVLTRLLAPPVMPTPKVAMRGGPYIASPSGRARIQGQSDVDIHPAPGAYGEQFITSDPAIRQDINKGQREGAADALSVDAVTIPGPGKAASLLGQAAKGAVAGGVTSGGLYAVQRGIRGEFPSLEGTAIAAGTGAALGGIAEPLLAIPGVRRAIARIPIPILKRFMTSGEAEELDAEAARFKPSEGVKRSMGPTGARSYDPQADAGFSTSGRPSVRAKGLPAPPSRAATGEAESAAAARGSGVRPSASEERITYLIRKPVLTLDEAAELERALGPRWKLMRGQGIMQHQAETLGLVRARRAAQGMPEPH